MSKHNLDGVRCQGCQNYDLDENYCTPRKKGMKPNGWCNTEHSTELWVNVIFCEECGHKNVSKESHFGKRFECPKCGHRFVVCSSLYRKAGDDLSVLETLTHKCVLDRVNNPYEQSTLERFMGGES